jgi:aminoglycoside phosphotransferase family enzyme
MSACCTPRVWTLAEKVAFLQSSGAYSGRSARIEAIETHFAWVFLTARHAYKLKKPVRQATMDYRTLAAREYGCREELRLNRRLARAVYLDVIPLTSRGGTLFLGKGGQVEDWLVKMRRLPSSRMLDRALARRSLNGAELARLIKTLYRFHARVKHAPMAPRVYVRRLRRRIADNQRALARAGALIRQPLVAAITRAQRNFIWRAAERLSARGACVVEGHGDLRAEHVHLGPPPAVIDCVEFSRDLRLLDPAEEIAFLSLEIERLGHRHLAADLLNAARTTRYDFPDQSILDFYMSCLACARAKIAIWHLHDPQFRNARPWIARASSYLRDAQRHIGAALRQLRIDSASGLP